MARDVEAPLSKKSIINDSSNDLLLRSCCSNSLLERNVFAGYAPNDLLVEVSRNFRDAVGRVRSPVGRRLLFICEAGDVDAYSVRSGRPLLVFLGSTLNMVLIMTQGEHLLSSQCTKGV